MTQSNFVLPNQIHPLRVVIAVGQPDGWWPGGGLPGFASRECVNLVGKNVQSVQTHLNQNKPEITQFLLIQ